MKFERYHIKTKNAPLPSAPPRIYVERTDACVHCGACVEACVYGVHERMSAEADTKVAVPRHESCVACHRCVNECPMDALLLHPHPDFIASGDAAFPSELLETLRYEAETGRVPVSGQGYRGPFAGPGFDALWTDMSEIVRPTRDGIHGRETISTEVELGRRPDRIEFDASGRPKTELPPSVRLPFPIFLDVLPMPPASALLGALAEAAHGTGTLLLIDQADWDRLPGGVALPGKLGVRLRAVNPRSPALYKDLSLIEIEDDARAIERLAEIERRAPALPVSVRLPLSASAPARAVALARSGAGILHLCADPAGWTKDEPPRRLPGALRGVDDALVAAGLRDVVTLLASGGIGRAEHVPKAMICGADAVGVDVAVLVALGLTRFDSRKGVWPEDAAGGELAAQRLKNLLNSWRDQLLEVLGAMGLREAARLQGESGRAMFFDELEREFQESLQAAPAAPAPAGGQPPDFIPPPVVPVKSELWRKVSKFQVAYTKDCIDCGLCVVSCPYGVHRRKPGALRMEAPASFGCIGPSCQTRHPAPPKGADGAGYCVQACPYDAITLRPNPGWETLGDSRWTADLLYSTWIQAETGELPDGPWEYRKGASGGGFDLLDFRFARGPEGFDPAGVDTSIELNRRDFGPRITLPVPWYGGGMSYGSVSLSVMLARARAARAWGTFVSTGEGGYPPELLPYKEHVITQVATGLFGVREDTLAAARIVEIKYAQGAKPGLGGHLLSDKNTETVAALRETAPGISLFSPFPFHSVYSVEDHKKHVDWIHATADALRAGGEPRCGTLVSAKVSTPADVDMVAVGCYYGGVHIIHLDGSYGGTGAAPDIAKKNIAMPIEYAIGRVHRFLVSEGIRDKVILMASGGLRAAHDIAKAIALGADGAVLGTSELVALGCTRCGNCESGRGCQHGIASTDPVLSRLIAPGFGAQRIINLYAAYRRELALIVWRLGLGSVRELRGRTDLLSYEPPERHEL